VGAYIDEEEQGHPNSFRRVLNMVEGICELETPAVIDASTPAANTAARAIRCPRQPPEFAVTDGSEQGLNKALGWYGLATYH